jgi:hypothetical protein
VLGRPGRQRGEMVAPRLARPPSGLKRGQHLRDRQGRVTVRHRRGLPGARPGLTGHPLRRLGPPDQTSASQTTTCCWRPRSTREELSRSRKPNRPDEASKGAMGAGRMWVSGDSAGRASPPTIGRCGSRSVWAAGPRCSARSRSYRLQTAVATIPATARALERAILNSKVPPGGLEPPRTV